jgi:hypothetical protein
MSVRSQTGGGEVKCKTAVLWWLINETKHDQVSEEEMKIESLMPIVEALFPGVNYFSFTGFSQVMNECVIPALKKQFPELVGASADSIDPDAESEISELLPSDGYEWQTSSGWRTQFDQLVAA